MKQTSILIASFFLLITSLSADSSLFYKVHKGTKILGYYEINYNDTKNSLNTKSYGVANKVSFFIDKNIDYVNSGKREMMFKKNNTINNFTVQTKLDQIDDKTKKKLHRKLRKVKNNDMLLLTKVGKNSIELFNKRKITLLTLDEILKLSIDNKIKKQNIILFAKSGIMKMIAQIVPTATGFDIINRSKDTKYIKVTVKNNIPTEVKSYISDWSLSIEGAGKFNINKVSQGQIDKKIENIIQDKLNNKEISFVNTTKITLKKKKYLVDFKANIDYPSNITKKDSKRYCKKISKKYSKKISNIEYNDTNCVASLRVNILLKKILTPIKKELIEQYPQLKFTKKFKVTKKGAIMYKIIDKVK